MQANNPAKVTKIGNNVLILFTVVMLCSCNGDNQSTEGNSKNSVLAFNPPLDGKLSEQQIKKYLHIKKLLNHQFNRQLGKANGITAETPANSAQTSAQTDQRRYYDELEKDAALSVEMNVKEYYWVKDTIINTQSIILLQRYYHLNQKIMHLLTETLSNYKNQQKQQKTAEQQSMNIYVDEMKQELANLDGKVAELGSLSEAELFNIELVSRYQSQLASVEKSPQAKPVN